MDISIVIPVYNSEKILHKLTETITSSINKKSFEIVFVYDCSPDNSWKVLEEISKKYSFVKAIALRKNSGQHNAIMAGLNYAVGDIIIMMDDDLQHSPKYIEELYEKIILGSDVCYTKYSEKKHEQWKIIGSKFNNFVASMLLKKDKDLYLSSFKAINAEIKNEIIKYDGPYVYIDGLILDVTSNITTLKVEHFSRVEGEGNYNLYRSVSLWLKMATNFSVVPLRVASIMGLVLSSFGFLLAIYFTIVRLFVDPELPLGWASLMVSVLVLGGIQLLTLGVIGEYLGRTFLKINKKPPYAIKEVLNRNG